MSFLRSSILLLPLLLSSVLIGQSKGDIYEGTPVQDYLTGNFQKEKALVLYKNPDDNREFYLRAETKAAFLKLREEYKKAHPEERQAPFLVSAFRSFSDQKSIWESKYTGKKKMREPVAGKTPEEIVSLILEFSSAPGTSRHHWGTDIDINALENSYFEKDGKGEKFYIWMKKNAYKYGFCQPYTPKKERNDKGYNEEKWHWSYAPLSNQFHKQWVSEYKSGKLKLAGKFLGADILGNLPLEYVNSINPECLKIK
ncbi:M15 family metallopeptidase [Leptospira wolffii]|uniref:M15 family metallopeptidase n=1 Tax=Leptospira wolffii TaxID=409998 RepID=A0ABV5BJ32_9LEPT